MALNLTKGQKINLVKDTGEKLEKFCVEVSWGAIKRIQKNWLGFEKTIIEDVDLDLSSILLNGKGELIDWVYSPQYNAYLQKNNLPLGKLTTFDHALKHSGDDLGQGGGDDFREIICIDLTKVNPEIDRIFFFLNIYLNAGQSFDFSQIPFAKIKMFEGTSNRVIKDHLSFDIVTDSTFRNKRALIMGKLYKKNNDWKFDAIGDASDDTMFLQTISRILNSYI